MTGSARLDFYGFGGDSLQGRYHPLRLHPLSAAEFRLETPKQLLQLLRLGGFPEPFFGGSDVDARRWSREYRNRLIREVVANWVRDSDGREVELRRRARARFESAGREVARRAARRRVALFGGSLSTGEA